MSVPSTQLMTTTKMGIYEPNHQFLMWSESFKNDSHHTSGSTIVEADFKLDNGTEDALHDMLVASKNFEQEANGPSEKVLRRLAQNREAARKSRLRKKAYLEQLETSRIKLAQLEQELGRVRQGLCMGGISGDSSVGLSGTINSGVATFGMEYGHWVEVQNQQVRELKTALQARVSDIELQILVENGMNHYNKLFHMKTIAANSDVFYILSGMWKTPAERFYMWIGGFRPSEILKVLSPQLDPLTEEQHIAVHSLQQTSQQAEDALVQGMNKLQQTLAETLISDASGAFGVANYMGKMATAMDQLNVLVKFVKQADNLRQQTLQLMYHQILNTRQAARGLLVLGDYFQRLRALSSLWAAHSCEPAKILR
ncbi:Transcription factor TGA4 [Acorus calamus]|uniref:Transcription factor TGA4 n=1 Tax=Acorus calamus TaxID=4465 RepID=A0AAV9ENH2_ACOCL|nr:Transcription factor TGA4 [Acorus calamus]